MSGFLPDLVRYRDTTVEYRVPSSPGHSSTLGRRKEQEILTKKSFASERWEAWFELLNRIRLAGDGRSELIDNIREHLNFDQERYKSLEQIFKEIKTELQARHFAGQLQDRFREVLQIDNDAEKRRWQGRG